MGYEVNSAHLDRGGSYKQSRITGLRNKQGWSAVVYVRYTTPREQIDQSDNIVCRYIHKAFFALRVAPFAVAPWWSRAILSSGVVQQKRNNHIANTHNPPGGNHPIWGKWYRKLLLTVITLFIVIT
jgi:hypothetical protein